MAKLGVDTSEDAILARKLAKELELEDKKREEADLSYAQMLHEQDTGTTATDFECAMCLEEFQGAKDLCKGIVTSCKHKFCTPCLLSYIEAREREIQRLVAKPRPPNAPPVDKEIKCPLCRTSIMQDANRVRRLKGLPPVSIPDEPPPMATNGPGRLPDLSRAIQLTCGRCNQRLLAPSNTHVRCVCGNLIPPTPSSTSLWRSDSQVIQESTLPGSQQAATLVVCPTCRRTFTAKFCEVIRCHCGTGLYVPLQQSQQQQPARRRTGPITGSR